jgi:Domain of unknown function (DUF4386)
VVFQLLEAITAPFGQVIVLDRPVVSGNAAATAANILGHERLFWLGFASSLIGVVFHIAWALLMYLLLKPVNRSLSLLAAFVILVGCAIQAFTSLLYLAPLLILQAGSYSTSCRFRAIRTPLTSTWLLSINCWLVISESANCRASFFGMMKSTASDRSLLVDASGFTIENT